MDNNKLIPVNSSVALAKTSVALSITDKLTFNQNQKMVKEIFLSNNDFFIDIISRYYPLNEILLEKYESEWKEVQIVYNTNVFWSDSIVEKFIYKNFLAIEENTDTDPYPVHLESLSEALIETYLSNWNQESLSPKKIKWTEEILEKFKYNWSWFYLSENKVLPWSESFIDKYFDKWDWEKLSKNE